jgi:hypothetical protein
MPLLLANERIIYTSSILVKPPSAIHLPSFLLPNPKRRQLILTDFPRLITVKEEANGTLSNRAECVFVVRGSALSSSTTSSLGRSGQADTVPPSNSAGGATKVLEIQDKGPKGFTVQTVSQDPVPNSHLRRCLIVSRCLLRCRSLTIQTSQLFSYLTDSAEIKRDWMGAFKRVQT